MQQLNQRAAAIKAIILEHIQKQAEEKLKPNSSIEEVRKYEPAEWLDRIAGLSSSVQLATFPAKATHPDIKIQDATSPFLLSNELPQHDLIGTHSISEDSIDGTGNAAALGVIKFLTLAPFEGKSLFHFIIERDPDIVTVLADLSDNQQRAQDLLEELAKVDRRADGPASHALAKQIYWLTGDEPTNDEHFHLLQPLFSSSLTHCVHVDLQDARFGEKNKLARQAKRDKKPHDGQYRHYSRLVSRKLGGTKPQNISQLNSERHGVNYLLDSSPPPQWRQDRVLKVLHVDSALIAFRRFEGVPSLLRQLQDFLKANPNSTMETRRRREAMERALGQQLSFFGSAVRGSYAPGWTRNSECHLTLCEQLWLDAERVELPVRSGEYEQEDIEFNKAYHQADWADEVATRFGAWLNERLREAGLNTVGDTELRHWSRQAIIDAQWPVPVQRRAKGGTA